MKQYDGSELIIMACSKCNIKCEHCYISYKGNRDPNELFDLVSKLKGKYNININGAEVLTDPNYLKSYNEIGQNFILSNGKVFLTDDNIIKKLKNNNIDSVSLSYHFGIQDEISPIRINDLNRTINIIKESGLSFRLLTTISASNYKMIPYMCKCAKELGARGIKFTNLLSQGNGKNMNQEEILNQNQIDEVFRLIESERNKYDKNDLLIERCGTFGKNIHSNHDHFYCDCITDSVVLTPDNNIYPCVFLAQPGYEIGKYKDGTIYIEEGYCNNHDECFARSICNENKRVLKKGE